MDTFFHTERFKKILKQYEDLRDHAVSCYLDAEELTDIAEYYHNNGNTQAAAEAIDYALKIFPGASVPTAFKARTALLVDEDPQRARHILEQTADKSDLEYIYAYAEILIAEKKANQADLYLQQHLQDAVPYGSDRDNYILDVAETFADYMELELAEKWLRQVSDQQLPDYWEIMARVQLQRGNYEESEEILNRLIDDNPFSTTYWNQLAASQLMHNHIAEAITSSEYSIALNPDDEEAILNKANGLFTLGNYEEAKKYYERYQQLQPDNESVALFLGLTFANQNQPQQAITHMEQALTLSQQHDSPHIQLQALQELALLEGQLGHVEKAMAYLAQSTPIDTDPAMTETLRGYVRLQNGQTQQAQAHFRKAIMDSQSSPHVLLHVAIAVYENGYLPMAFKLFTLLMATADEEWDEGYAYYARCCYELGHQELFQEALRTAVSKNPEEARLVLADLYPPGTPPHQYPQTPLS